MRKSLGRGRTLTFLLLLAVLCQGCKDSLRTVKAGPLFAAPEKAPPSKALVYIYWPREQQGRRSHLWVTSCEGRSQEILPGGYTALVVEPGPSCFEAEALSELKHTPAASVGASVGQSLGSVELNAEPGRTFFIRLEQERRLLISGIALRPVRPEIAGPEIRRCRQSLPLTPDELYRQSLEEIKR